jgi:hypothetical protein
MYMLVERRKETKCTLGILPMQVALPNACEMCRNYAHAHAAECMLESISWATTERVAARPFYPSGYGHGARLSTEIKEW